MFVTLTPYCNKDRNTTAAKKGYHGYSNLNACGILCLSSSSRNGEKMEIPCSVNTSRHRPLPHGFACDQCHVHRLESYPGLLLLLSAAIDQHAHGPVCRIDPESSSPPGSAQWQARGSCQDGAKRSASVGDDLHRFRISFKCRRLAV